MENAQQLLMAYGLAEDLEIYSHRKESPYITVCRPLYVDFL